MSIRGLILLVPLLALSSCSVCMPGESHEGQAPPLSAEEQARRDRLQAHVFELADKIGQRNRSNHEALAQARDYIAQELRLAGYDVTIQPYEFNIDTFHNVEAILSGTTDEQTCIVVGAHYDSVEGSPGANDNASGVAVLIELARALRAQPAPISVRFVGFANEEPPYFNNGEGMGSIEYVKTFADPATTIRAMISVETVGLYSDEPGSQHYPPLIGRLYPDRGNFIAFVGNTASRRLVRDAVDQFRSAATLPSEGAALPASLPGVSWSDHRSFWEVGVPALMVTDTAPFRDPHYHLSTDTPARLDYSAMSRLVEGLAHVVPQMAR